MQGIGWADAGTTRRAFVADRLTVGERAITYGLSSGQVQTQDFDQLTQNYKKMNYHRHHISGEPNYFARSLIKKLDQLYVGNLNTAIVCNIKLQC